MKLSHLIENQTGSLIGSIVRGSSVDSVIKYEKHMAGVPWNFTFDCSNQNITSLEHAPSSVNAFMFDHNRLISLKGIPTSNGFISLSNNLLTNLNYLQRDINGWLDVSYNRISSVESFPASVLDNFYITNNHLTSLHNIHKYLRLLKGRIWLSDNPITKQILGLLLINGLQSIIVTSKHKDSMKLSSAVSIVNKYLPNTRGMVGVNECQDELIEAGLEDYAEL